MTAAPRRSRRQHAAVAVLQRGDLDAGVVAHEVRVVGRQADVAVDADEDASPGRRARGERVTRTGGTPTSQTPVSGYASATSSAATSYFRLGRAAAPSA